MFTAISSAVTCAKATVHGWFQRVFKEQAGGAEVIATLVIVAVVLALALMFKDKLYDLVAGLWNSMVGQKGKPEDPVVPTW